MNDLVKTHSSAAATASRDTLNRQLPILVLEHLHNHTAALARQLHNEGYEQVEQLKLKQLLGMDINQVQPHLLVVECQNIDNQLLAVMELLNGTHPCPMLLCSYQHCSSDQLEQAMRAGACNYLGPENIGSGNTLPCLHAIIATTQMQFQRLQTLRNELQSLKVRLADRKQIERAKGLLMKQHQCDEEQAYAALRTLSMNRGINMGDMARELLQRLDG